jgi:hypothetical protein
LLQRAERDGRVTGVLISAGGFYLTHIFFADDSLLFYRANFTYWGNVLQMLHTYELASSKS